ncbi:hypothetical protein ACDF64_16655 [Agromyces sp. MMS24-JH15]|uniref:hypothetical protein n=1 Tax=Agromyces sp. MMS24-JH15 TaxID=3243765 RepID=UPI003748A06D
MLRVRRALRRWFGPAVLIGGALAFLLLAVSTAIGVGPANAGVAAVGAAPEASSDPGDYVPEFTPDPAPPPPVIAPFVAPPPAAPDEVVEEDDEFVEEPAPQPTVTPTPAPSPAPSRAPSIRFRGDADVDAAEQPVPPADPTSRDDPGAPSALGSSLPSFIDLFSQPLPLALSAAVGALTLFMITVPAHLLDDTLEANVGRFAGVTRWFAPFVAWWAALSARLPHSAVLAPVIVVLGAVAFGFTDPSYGVDIVSLRETLALAIGLALVLPLPAFLTQRILARRWTIHSHIVVHPGALLLAVIGVVVSRAFGLHPGLLIGLIMGLEIASAVKQEARQWAIAIRLGLVAAIAFAAWAGYSLLDVVAPAADHGMSGVGVGTVDIAASADGIHLESHGSDDGHDTGGTTETDTGHDGTATAHESDFGTELLRETLVATTHEGLATAMVALIPITFLEGKVLFQASKLVWAAIAVPVVFLFAFALVPMAIEHGSAGGEVEVTVVLPWAIALGAITLLVLAVWYGFVRYDRDHPGPAHGEEGPGDGRSDAAGSDGSGPGAGDPDGSAPAPGRPREPVGR